MSGTVIRYLHCDGCGEPHTVDPMPSTREGGPGSTVNEQRRDAAAEGWSVNLPGGRDLCPNCRS